MAHDTLQSNSTLKKAGSSFLNLLFKLHLLVPEENETEEDGYVEEEAPSHTRSNPQKHSAAHKREPSVHERNYNARMGKTHPQQTRENGKSLQKAGLVKRRDQAVYYVSSVTGCGEVIDSVIAGTTVTIYFEDTDNSTAQRIIDTLAGAAFALRAKIRKITVNTFIIAPEGVKVDIVRPIEKRY